MKKLIYILIGILLAGAAYWFFSSDKKKKFVTPDPITNIDEAYVTLYDDHHFSDRKLTINFDEDISNFDNVISDNGERGFGDKTSSARWQIPSGWKFVLYDDKGYKDRFIELKGEAGEYREIADMDTKDFGDKTSSGRWLQN